jgi:hypothetical protein
MPNTIQDVFHNGGSDALPLVFRSYSHVVYCRLVPVIRDCSTKSYQLITIVNEHRRVAVLERFTMNVRLAICHPDPFKCAGNGAPVHAGAVERYTKIHDKVSYARIRGS